MARYQQTFTNSCGAASLMCAASELGVDHLPKRGLWSTREAGTPITGNNAAVYEALLGWDSKPYQNALVSGQSKVEKAIYAVTSGDMASYSLPSRVIAAAKLMGLDVRMYAASGTYKSLLQWLYKDQLQACEDQGITISHTASPGPTGAERELVIVSTFKIGLHYVLRRPLNGQSPFEYMDPADGGEYRDFESMNSWSKCYERTGISFILSRP